MRAGSAKRRSYPKSVRAYWLSEAEARIALWHFNEVVHIPKSAPDRRPHACLRNKEALCCVLTLRDRKAAGHVLALLAQDQEALYKVYPIPQKCSVLQTKSVVNQYPKVFDEQCLPPCNRSYVLLPEATRGERHLSSEPTGAIRCVVR